jgi:DNA-binding GntR family transcriptional regulator
VSSSPPLLQPAAGEARSLSVQAYFRIRELIVSLELQPGSIVDERALMARLGIGRTPVREALRLLAREGLVEIHPRRGMFVSSVEVGDLAALSEVRAVLESLAARLAAERRTAEDEVELLDELAGAGASTSGRCSSSTSASTGTSGAARTTRSSRRRSMRTSCSR